MKRSNSVIWIVVLLFVSGCNQTDGDKTAVRNAYSAPTKSNYLHGIWQSSAFMYTADLTLQADGTFMFRDHGCTGQRWSAGKWNECQQSVWADTCKCIMLTSYESNRRNETPLRSDSSFIYFDGVTVRAGRDTLYIAAQKWCVHGLKFVRERL